MKLEDEAINGEVFSEEAIRKAFATFDLDGNGFIGHAELKHILIMMGQQVSNEEVEMMISMLDINGNGQVNYSAFKAMMECPDPSNEDFLKQMLLSPSKIPTTKSITKQQRRKIFSRAVETSRMSKEDIIRMLDFILARKRTVPNTPGRNFRISLDDLSSVMPAVSTSQSDCREMFSSVQNGSVEDDTIDGRTIIMALANMVPDLNLEAKSSLAFKLYDVEHSGYLSIDNIESVLASTNLDATRDLARKRAETFFACADTDGSGRITVDEFILGAQKLPNLVFPRYSNAMNNR